MVSNFATSVPALAQGAANAKVEEAVVLSVSLVHPQVRNWPESVPAGGWLKPWHEAIIASEIGGLRIDDLVVDVGSDVEKGDPLAFLARESVLADLKKQEAQLKSAEADLAKAKTNADRARKVQGSGALSDEKVTEYLIAEQTAQASLESARADLENQRIQVDHTTIRAVDDGQITSRSAQLGQVVSSGTELFRLLRQNKVEWQAEVPALYLPRLRSGLDAVIEGPDGNEIKGTVRLVGPTINTDTGRAIIYVSLPPESSPRVGLYASGVILLGSKDALTVPESALVFRDGINYVFSVGPDKRTKRLLVKTGRRFDEEVEILSGIEDAANIVESGGAFLSDGALVKVVGEAQ
ncbi:efflux RND transporter periplasmic adaptor subunit [uncultured Cohaesibacter sp.]|uniref:efflux RND transporter periplasmic adaptor subunit n=1 Tax=uncultured Cohaesibacter sp. TaxID=1002546 RepID=UPI0037498CA9